VSLRHLRIATVGTVLAALSTPSAAPQTGSTAPTTMSAEAPEGNAERGEILYRKTACYQCHSEQAQGGSQGPRLGPNPIPFRAFERYLRAPSGEMPPYSVKVMSDQVVADLYAFLRALPPPPPLSSIPLLQP